MLQDDKNCKGLGRAHANKTANPNCIRGKMALYWALTCLSNLLSDWFTDLSTFLSSCLFILRKL